MQTEATNQAVYTEFDAFLFHQGTNHEAYRKLGAHPCAENGVAGTRFAVWAPHAQYVGVLMAKTGWDNEKPMSRCPHDGAVCEGFLPDVGAGVAYHGLLCKAGLF